MSEAPRKTIVIAWVDTVSEPIDWHSCRIDLGERPKFKRVLRPHAVTWLLAGTTEDITKAWQYADREVTTGQVYTFPTSETDPLGAARAKILEKYK